MTNRTQDKRPSETNYNRDAAYNTGKIIQCYVCHKIGDYKFNACRNGDILITIKNRNFEQLKTDNAKEDAEALPKQLRVAVVTMNFA